MTPSILCLLLALSLAACTVPSPGSSPSRASPDVRWSQVQRPSATGPRRLMERLGGNPLHIESIDCPARAERQGDNRLHLACTVRFSSGSAPQREGRRFGTILERHGRFKFVSFANMR